MNKWTDGFLDLMKNEADPLADQVVAALFEKGEIAQLNRVLDQLDSNQEAIPEDFPAPVAEFLRATETLPPWAEEKRLLRAQETFTRNGPAFGVALMYASLPSLYAGAMGGVQILAMTGTLRNHFRRRAAETLRFILDVMSPGGLAPRGRGIRTAQKVRLMHATIRHFARVSGRWAALPDWGQPINQEELAGTLLAFSAYAVDILEKLDVHLSEDQAEDILHTWQAIGHVLGIQPELYPENLEDARALWSVIAKRNFKPTREAVQLGQSHLAFLNELLPGKALDGTNPALMRFLMGRRLAVRCLGLPSGGWHIALVYVLRAWFGFAEVFWQTKGPLSVFLSRLHLEMMEALQRYWQGADPGGFRLPEHLDPADEGPRAATGDAAPGRDWTPASGQAAPSDSPSSGGKASPASTPSQGDNRT